MKKNTKAKRRRIWLIPAVLLLTGTAAAAGYCGVMYHNGYRLGTEAVCKYGIAHADTAADLSFQDLVYLAPVAAEENYLAMGSNPLYRAVAAAYDSTQQKTVYYEMTVERKVQHKLIVPYTLPTDFYALCTHIELKSVMEDQSVYGSWHYELPAAAQNDPAAKEICYRDLIFALDREDAAYVELTTAQETQRVSVDGKKAVTAHFSYNAEPMSAYGLDANLLHQEAKAALEILSGTVYDTEGNPIAEYVPAENGDTLNIGFFRDITEC